MKLELLERDRNGHETRTSSKQLELSEELSLHGACTLRVVESKYSQEYTLQIVASPGREPEQEVAARSLTSGPLSLLRNRVALALDVSDQHLQQMSPVEIRALAILIGADGKILSSQAMALQLGGLFWQPAGDEIAALLNVLEQQIATLKLPGRLTRHPDGASSFELR